jgi:UDP-2-acetamido-2,6-beta-L-arabino-hexul-4-ose reductase
LFLVEQIISSLIRTKKTPHLIYSSSIQEEKDNLYGKSKNDCRLILSKWANDFGAKFTGLIIPNVFGPFGLPYYNSVIATFSHQLAKGESTKIEVNGDLKLIYVGDLVDKIIGLIREGDNSHKLIVPFSIQTKVSEILVILESFKLIYQEKGEIPFLKNDFELKLFNTFRSYFDLGYHFPKKFVKNSDERGYFVEIGRQGIPGQISFSTSLTGITRGNHFHTRKIERFSVIKGNALIQLRKIGSELVHEFYLNGDSPAYVDMPIWYTHNIMTPSTCRSIWAMWNSQSQPFIAKIRYELVQ